MTPAIKSAKRAKITFEIHEYKHDPQSDSYGEEAAEKLGIDKNRLFKTLLVTDDKAGLHVAILPVSQQLNLKMYAKTAKVKKVAMADKKVVERTTGYVVGGVSPLGQKKRLPTIVSDSAADFETIFVSAGKRGLEIELSPDNLVELTNGNYGAICG